MESCRLMPEYQTVTWASSSVDTGTNTALQVYSQDFGAKESNAPSYK